MCKAHGKAFLPLGAGGQTAKRSVWKISEIIELFSGIGHVLGAHHPQVPIGHRHQSLCFGFTGPEPRVLNPCCPTGLSLLLSSGHLLLEEEVQVLRWLHWENTDCIATGRGWRRWGLHGDSANRIKKYIGKQMYTHVETIAGINREMLTANDQDIIAVNKYGNNHRILRGSPSGNKQGSNCAK